MKEIVVGYNEEGQRMDKLLAKVLNQCSKSFLYKMLRKKNIKLNEKKAEGREILKAGDRIQIYFSDETYEKLTKREVVKTGILPAEFSVLYEDEDVVIMNKWAGALSQKAKPEDISMNEYLISYLLAKNALDSDMLKTFTPSICNRLDRNTTGILVGGASLKGLQVMAKALRDRSVAKFYYALVEGEVKKGQYIKGYLLKNEETNQVKIVSEKEAFAHGLAAPIETEYEVVFKSKELSLLKVHLITGKTHQIRAHLAYEGHPIVGDRKYGNEACNKKYLQKFGVRYQLLHAVELVFPEDFDLPNLAGKTISAPLPSAFDRIVKETFH